MTDQIALLVSIAALGISLICVICSRPTVEVYVAVPTEIQAALDKLSADLDVISNALATPANDADILAAVQAVQARADTIAASVPQ